MKIIISEDAARYYKNVQLRQVGQYSESYYKKLLAIQDKELEVETDHLFADQFNTAEMRVMGSSVYRVINDERIGLYTDSTGKHYKNKQGEFISDPFLKKFVIHPNPLVSEGGVFLYEVYINDLTSVPKYLRLCKEFGTQPDSEFTIE